MRKRLPPEVARYEKIALWAWRRYGAGDNLRIVPIWLVDYNNRYLHFATYPRIENAFTRIEALARKKYLQCEAPAVKPYRGQD
jgi:hypothetical protein